MGPTQPGPRRGSASVREALRTRLTALRALCALRSVKALFAVMVVGGLMVLGAAPARSFAVVHSVPTTEPPRPPTAVATTPNTPATTPTITPAAPAARAPPEATVCINDANPEALRRLPGVGEKRARAIIELRTRLGKLKRPEDLLRVKGLGRKRLAKIRPLLRFSCDPPASATSDAPAPR
jgi:competence protein ComEA